MDELRERVRELEDQVFKKDSIVQQYKSEISEKERAIKEKNTSLEEKCRAYEEICAVSDRRKRQIDQLRMSVKARDDALTDLNNKHRALLSQVKKHFFVFFFFFFYKFQGEHLFLHSVIPLPVWKRLYKTITGKQPLDSKSIYRIRVAKDGTKTNLSAGFNE